MEWLLLPRLRPPRRCSSSLSTSRPSPSSAGRSCAAWPPRPETFAERWCIQALWPQAVAGRFRGVPGRCKAAATGGRGPRQV